MACLTQKKYNRSKFFLTVYQLTYCKIKENLDAKYQSCENLNLARIKPAHIGVYSCNEFGFASDNFGAICTDIYQPEGSILLDVT